MGYEGTQIYVMHFGHTFMYLFSWRTEIFKNYIEMRPPVWAIIGKFFRILPSAYSLEQLEGGEQVMLSAAMDSVDKLKKMAVKRDKVAEIDKRCMWRVRLSEEGKGLYECLYHKVEVPIEKGKMPRHDITSTLTMVAGDVK